MVFKLFENLKEFLKLVLLTRHLSMFLVVFNDFIFNDNMSIMTYFNFNMITSKMIIL